MDKQFWRQVGGIIGKDLRQWGRDRQAALAPLLLPLVLMLISGVLFGFGGDAWPIGLVVKSEGPQTRRLVRAMETASGTISPYFQIVTREEGQARQWVQDGRLHMVVTVPADFESQWAEGEATLETQIFNINTDMTKNVRLRLEHALQRFAAAQDEAPLTIAQQTTRAEDVWRRAFIAGGALVVALLVGASLNTAVMIGREWEKTTVKELQLAPGVVGATLTGKIGAGLIATAVNLLLTWLAAALLFGLRIPAARLPTFLPLALGIALTAAGLGLAAGAFFRDYRVIQPLLVVIAVGSFFAAGGFSSVSTLPPLVRRFAVFWPPAYAFESMQQLMHAAARPAWGIGSWMILAGSALASLLLAYLSLRRALR